MSAPSLQQRRRRGRGARLVGTSLLTLLLLAFLRVQVFAGPRWTLRARANHLRPVVVPAARGSIVDRNGRILADNVPGYVVTLPTTPGDSLRPRLGRLGPLLGLGAQELDALARRVQGAGGDLVVDRDADFRTVSVLEERLPEFPELDIRARPRRRYPAGSSLAHLLGHVGRISASELEAADADGYRAESIVGKTGIEREYEARLRGRDGVRYVEVDVRGRVTGDFASGPSIAALPGRDLVLNLDLDLQAWIDHIFPDSLAGAVVALDPSDGGVLALYSAPTFDPNAFVGEIDDSVWQRRASDPRRPLFNRATRGLYAPASTWKPAAAAIALEMGVVDPREYMPEPCRGWFRWGGRIWHCWKRDGHGYNNLAEALGNSSDVYFYQLGLRVGLDRLLRRASDLGFGGRTGIDLPQESRGVFPADREFWERRFGYDAQESEVLSLAIGQGPNAQTPLRMAQFYEALARDGSAPPPTVARGATLGPGWRLNLSAENLAALREGLRRVTAPGGTAHLGATLEHFEVLGKTGTGQNPASLAGRGADDAWFAAMAGPFGQAPEIVVVVLVEQGGSGSGVAAPIAAKTADFYLRRLHGIPMDTIQTLGEWVRTRGWPTWYRERYGESR